MGIKIYTTPECVYCNMAKKYLETRKVLFQEVNVTADNGASAEMVAKSGQRGVPVIDFDGTVVVGFDKDKIDNILRLT